MRFDFTEAEGWMWVMGAILVIKLVDVIWKIISPDD